MPVPITLSHNERVSYSRFFDELDTSKTDLIPREKVALFFQRSQLPNATLAKIWDLCKPVRGDRDFDRTCFFAGLRLIALAQFNQPLDSYALQTNNAPIACMDFSTENAPFSAAKNTEEIAPFNSAISSRFQPSSSTLPSSSPAAWDPWKIGEDERKSLFSVFNDMNPLDGTLSCMQLQDYLQQRKMPNDVQHVILQIVDLNRDGYLDFDDFSLAAHLTEGIISGILRITASGFELSPLASHESEKDYAKETSMKFQIQLEPTPEEREKYKALFRHYEQENKGIPAVKYEQAAEILAAAHLEIEDAVSLWSLANDRGEDELNETEFLVLMHAIRLKRTGDMASLNHLVQEKQERQNDLLRSKAISSAIASSRSTPAMTSPSHKEPAPSTEVKSVKLSPLPPASIMDELKRVLLRRQAQTVANGTDQRDFAIVSGSHHEASSPATAVISRNVADMVLRSKEQPHRNTGSSLETKDENKFATGNTNKRDVVESFVRQQPMHSKRSNELDQHYSSFHSGDSSRTMAIPSSTQETASLETQLDTGITEKEAMELEISDLEARLAQQSSLFDHKLNELLTRLRGDIHVLDEQKNTLENIRDTQLKELERLQSSSNH